MQSPNLPKQCKVSWKPKLFQGQHMAYVSQAQQCVCADTSVRQHEHLTHCSAACCKNCMESVNHASSAGPQQCKRNSLWASKERRQPSVVLACMLSQHFGAQFLPASPAKKMICYFRHHVMVACRRLLNVIQQEHAEIAAEAGGEDREGEKGGGYGQYLGCRNGWGTVLGICIIVGLVHILKHHLHKPQSSVARDYLTCLGQTLATMTLLPGCVLYMLAAV